MNSGQPPPAKKLTQLFCGGQKQVHPRGNILMRGDYPSERFYYIDEGFIKAYSLNTHGDEYVHLLLGPGDIFPLIGLINNTVRDIFYEAHTKVIAYAYPRKWLQEHLNTDIAITQGMLWQSLRQLTIYTDRLDNLEFKYTQERLIYRLILLLTRFGERLPGGKYVIAVPLSQQVLAASINASRESVNRELERLARKGAISYNRRSVTINDLEALIKQLPQKLNFDMWSDITHNTGILRAKNHL